MELIKCAYDKLLVTTHLLSLLKKYKLTKFLCFWETIYPRLVRMFYVNLGFVDDKVSCYVMHKHVIIDVKLLAKEFEMDVPLLKLQAQSFLNYKKELAIDMLFPYQTPRDSSGKTLIMGLSREDQILYFVICKVLFP